ncbi:2OG-Fe(II) oxygenase superfamily [Chryseobacterium taklimakanense]|uniref:2OG-Fe(II) oxygenase superfamily n=1 Tax=Chryseobacterium taklimakanense TaxID=536441 RepID=A0A239XKY0_9FLAO|nr:2-oxoglutarate and iron-dependent oxygenase domain-containing protein [Chryseobacterium taklimakanense]SNV46803.1 2OG-Fe(II) oxygenase superfamily [Chryseobacterium taklimakanense]
MNKIPSVDLRDFLSDDPARKQKFVNEIGKAYEDIGFVALKGHFLDDALVKELYGEVKNFFDLPVETKQKYEIPGIGGQRGYVGFGKETAKGFKKADLKEFWHFGQYLAEDSKYSDVYPDNVTVAEVPKFNEVGKKAYQMLEKTGKYVLRALALYLGLNEFYFDQYIAEGNSILRPIHYPPITQEPEDAVRAAAHGDINLITLLMGAQGRGLQVQNHEGEWIDAIAEPDELMINVGDMLSRHTNNKLKSTIHRVVNPDRELWGTSRYSIPFFMHPVSEMKLDALEGTYDENNPKLYPDTTAGEFLHERLVELGLIK